MYKINFSREGVCLLNLVNSIKHFSPKKFYLHFCGRSYQYLKNYEIKCLTKLTTFLIFLWNLVDIILSSQIAKKNEWNVGAAFGNGWWGIRKQQKRNFMSWVSFYTPIQSNAVSHNFTIFSYTECLKTISFFVPIFRLRSAL